MIYKNKHVLYMKRVLNANKIQKFDVFYCDVRTIPKIAYNDCSKRIRSNKQAHKYTKQNKW